MNRHRLRPVAPAGWTTFFFAALFMTAAPGGAVAHEEAVLSPAHSVVVAGDSLQLAGREFDPDKDYKLRLVGPLRDYALGSARADSAGRFLVVIETPWEALPGFYQLTATADDGDIVARADLAVTSVNDRQTARGSDSGAPGGLIDTERTRSGVEWAIIGLLVSGSGLLGLWSLIRAGRSPA